MTRRARSAKIVATLGPSTSDEAAIRALFERGVDVFRLNFSHGTQSDHAQRLRTIRALELEFGRPIGVMLDLQGPKLRLGTFAGGRTQLEAGAQFLPLASQASASPTEVMTTTSALLKAANLAVFELGMWQSWTGR